MNRDEFITEVIRSDVCPENFRESYNKFQDYQADVLRTLVEFHRVCEKNHIPYQLAFGSLLGAIRDGGQIPWDYDVDVMVPFDEKEHLIKSLTNDLDKNYYFYCPEVDCRCRHVIMRVAPIEYRTEVLHVDVFYVTGSPDDKAERNAFTSELSEVTKVRVDRLINIKEEAMGNPRVFFSMLIKRRIPSLFRSLNQANKRYNELCNQYKYSDSQYCVLADRYAKDYIYQSKIMFKTQLYDAKYGTIRIPIEYDEILRHDYGDYMSIPPLNKRIEEFLHSYNRITTFMKMNGKTNKL